MEYGNSFVLWVLLKINDCKEEHKECSTMSKVLIR